MVRRKPLLSSICLISRFLELISHSSPLVIILVYTCKRTADEEFPGVVDSLETEVLILEYLGQILFGDFIRDLTLQFVCLIVGAQTLQIQRRGFIGGHSSHHNNCGLIGEISLVNPAVLNSLSLQQSLGVGLILGISLFHRVDDLFIFREQEAL